MEVFVPVDEALRDALLAGAFDGTELYGQERIEWDASGAYADALWVAARVDDAIAAAHEDPDSKYLGYRPFTFDRALVNGLSWRVVPADEVAAARVAEADALEEFRKRQRDP